MKVILSIDPVRFPLTGIGRYTYELARHLGDIPEIEQLRFFAGHRFANALPESAPSRSGDFRRLILNSRIAAGAFRITSRLLKQRTLRGYEDFLFHGPNFYLPPFDGPKVSTFHDLSMFTWAHSHPPGRVRYMQKEIQLMLKHANMLVTDSEYTRCEIATYFGWPLEKIRVVPLACSPDFRPRSHSETRECLRKYSLSFNGYTLYTGTIEPRKNIQSLLGAYMLLPQQTRLRWPLVIAGYRGWKSEELHSRMKAAERAGWLRYLGYMPSNDLPLLFSGARLFVFPSLYEGFGLPVLEAMASGVPVVCSNASSLPEVAGGAAAMCVPNDVETMANLIVAGLEDTIWRAEAKAKGLSRAKVFSWRRCATETAAVYRDVLSCSQT